ncbi:MAG: PGF-pre-PGF domain-containing protein [Candidatus Methanoperedens sp.]|nr:PGF-pre-PGF domain-containing protein [Candidatus Methanoperedens sp.]
MKGSTFVFITEVKTNLGFNNISQDYQVILPIAPPSLNIYFVYVSMFEETTKINGEIKTNGELFGESCANGVVIKEEINNIQFYEISERYLQKNVTKIYFFAAPDLSIYEIITTPWKSFGSICIRNEQLKDQSKIKDLTTPEGIIYEYVNINSGIWELSNPVINDTVIKFRIKNDWFKSNDLEVSSIILQLWNKNKWILLETEKTNSDEKFIYYQAKTDAFGIFAISSIHQPNFPAIIPTTTLERIEKKILPYFPWWYIGISIFCIIIYYYKYHKH